MLTYCSSKDHRANEFKALVFEYMGIGSLETWLHPNNENESRNLNFLERINVGIDVASALHYLHDLCKKPIVHCDLKPSNVLLDDNFVACVCDFGLARILSNCNTMSETTGIKGTIGYAAPECGIGSTVSKEGDVYSFGILLLEMFTGRKPIDKMLEDGLNLHDFFKKALPDRVMEIVDQRLFIGDDRILVEQDENFLTGFCSTVEKHTVSILTIGLACSVESPKGRTTIKDVRELSLIRDAFVDEIRPKN